MKVGDRVRFSSVGFKAMTHGPYKARTGSVESVLEDTVLVWVDAHRQPTWYPAACWEPLPPEKDPNAQP